MMTEESRNRLAQIVPGKTFPTEVVIKEKDGTGVKILLASYVTGLYMAFYFNGNSLPHQVLGSHKAKTKYLIQDIKNAIYQREADVEIGPIKNIALELERKDQ